MFSLIITLISIALVAALALATLYYGGSSWTRGNAAASAATMTNQGQQIRAAMELYYTDHSAYPATLADLTTDDGHMHGVYLKAIPVPPASLAALAPSAVTNAMAGASSLWTLLAGGQPAFMVHETVPQDVCQELNYLARGSDAVREKIDPAVPAQCFGPAGGPFTYVVGVPADAGASASLAQAVNEYNAASDPDLPVVTEADPSNPVTVAETKNKSGAASAPPETPPETPPEEAPTGALSVVREATDMAVVGESIFLELKVTATGSPVSISSVTPVSAADYFESQCDGSEVTTSSECYVFVEVVPATAGAHQAQLLFTLADASSVVKTITYQAGAANPLALEIGALPSIEMFVANTSPTGILLRNTAGTAVTLAELSLAPVYDGFGMPATGITLASGGGLCQVGSVLAAGAACEIRFANSGAADGTFRNDLLYPLTVVGNPLIARADGYSQLYDSSYVAVLEPPKTAPYTVVSPSGAQGYSWANAVANGNRVNDTLVVSNSGSEATTFKLEANGTLVASTGTPGCLVRFGNTVTVNAGVTCTIAWNEEVNAGHPEFTLYLTPTNRTDGYSAMGQQSISYDPVY